MSRLFIDQPLSEHSEVTVTDEIHHYISNVLRMKTGDPLYVFNGAPHQYAATIRSTNRKKTIIQLKESVSVDTESPLKVIIAQSVPKGQKMDDLIPKITELGVFKIVPLITDRSDLKKVSDNKLNRWQKIATHSAEQTGRSIIPKISSPMKLSEFLSVQTGTNTILLYELEESLNLKSTLQKITSNTLTLIIGPEGGFSPEEIESARAQGCHIVSLGKRILRTETVAPAVLAIVQFMKGDM